MESASDNHSFMSDIMKMWDVWWASAYLMQGVLILIGNALTIAVFRKRRAALKKPSLLLINMSFADLLVGVGEIVLSAYALLRVEVVDHLALVVVSWISFTITASIATLAVIAVERAFAVIKPFQHRAAPTAYYHRAIGLVWALAIIVATLFGLYIEQVSPCARIGIVGIYSSCLLTIALSYFMIWRSLSNKQMGQLNVHGQERNSKLAQTLSIVTLISMCCWLPIQALSLPPSSKTFLSGSVTLRLSFLFIEFMNSLFNPVVYVLRMPDFRQELKRLFVGNCCRDRQEVMPMATITGRTVGEGSHSSSFGESGSYRRGSPQENY